MLLDCHRRPSLRATRWSGLSLNLLSGSFACPATLVLVANVWFALTVCAENSPLGIPDSPTRVISGWTVHVSGRLLDEESVATARALELLRSQLEEIAHVVPQTALVELQKVPLWVSPEYLNVEPRAEYHPDANWLRANGRDPAMATGVEFTNVRIFEQELTRMPNFALHELAHAYHDRVLPQGFGNPRIRSAYEKAKIGGKYDRVECRNGNGKPNTQERAYAMNDPMEYFAETSEAYFSRNDFFPFNRDELRQCDPEMNALLEQLWGVDSQTTHLRDAKPRQYLQ